MNTKIIYKITNNINNCTYIGQTRDANKRWTQHQKNQRSSIGKAIHFWGSENFSFEVIEECENYTERENYWIDYYDSIESGYNRSRAYYCPINYTQSALSKKLVGEIETLLVDLNVSYDSIMKRYGCSSETITKINRGLHKFSNYSFSFPIANRANITKYKEEVILEIIEALQYTELSMKEIGVKFNISNLAKISDINTGKHAKCPDNIHYPIRSKNFNKCYLSLNDIWEIELILENTKDSVRKISIKFNTSANTIKSINIGTAKGSYIKRSSYPIR
jgi:group I intron endonuclease